MQLGVLLQIIIFKSGDYYGRGVSVYSSFLQDWCGKREIGFDNNHDGRNSFGWDRHEVGYATNEKGRKWKGSKERQVEEIREIWAGKSGKMLALNAVSRLSIGVNRYIRLINPN